MTITLPEQDQIDQAMDQLVADLQAARDLIAEGGLCKRLYQSPGGHCIVGALAEVAGLSMFGVGHPRVMRAVHALASTAGLGARDRFDPDCHARSFVYAFNDMDATTQADVLGLFDTAIARLRA